MLCEDHTYATPKSNVAAPQKTVANVRSAVNVWALKCSIYTMGLETDEVAEANAEDTGSDKVALSSDKMAIKC